VAPAERRKASQLSCLLRGTKRAKQAPRRLGGPPSQGLAAAAGAAGGGGGKKAKVKIVGDGLSNTSKQGVASFRDLSEQRALRLPRWLCNSAARCTNTAPAARVEQGGEEDGEAGAALAALELTEIQRHSIPAAIEGRDLLAIAPTGSGKTLSFLVPAVSLALRAKKIERNKLLKRRQTDIVELGDLLSFDPSEEKAKEKEKERKSKGPYAVLISPTRELASQTCRELRRLLAKAPKKKRLQVVLLTKSNHSDQHQRDNFDEEEAGEEAEAHRAEAKKKKGKAGDRIVADILVSTPPRLSQAIASGQIKLSRCRMLVLDEADKLFSDETFLEPIDAIMTSCTHKRLRRCVYTATLPEAAEELLRNVMQQPVRITVGERNVANSLVKQRLVFCGDEGLSAAGKMGKGKKDAAKKGRGGDPSLRYISGKLSAMRELVSTGELVPPVLVFVQSKDRASQLYEALRFDGINMDVIHAGRTAKERARAVQNFRSGATWFLVTTDLMARGMDILGVNTVVNFDCPGIRSDYVHRVGRTGRAGRPGKCITLYTEEDFGSLHMIASCMKTSGNEAPEWMLQLPRKHGGAAKKHVPPKRSNIMDDHETQQRQKKEKKRQLYANKGKGPGAGARKKPKKA